MSDRPEELAFKCRRSPSLLDWFWMTFYAALITSQMIRCLQLGGLWMAALILAPFLCWSLVKIVRKRLESDLVLGRHQFRFTDSQRSLEKVYYSAVLKLTEGPAHLRLRHENERMLFPRSLTLHRHSFAPQDWETLTALIIERVRKRAPNAELDTLASHFPPPMSPAPFAPAASVSPTDHLPLITRHFSLPPMTDLEITVQAALEAGKLLKANFGHDAHVDEATHHDIKLALDKESQSLIEGILLGARPGDAFYGEEGISGDQSSNRQWIVDPIDGTVNFFYNIPHFCISIALRVDDEVVLGVIHDPIANETWTVEKGGQPTLNGKPISASKRETLEESILFIGCGKDEEALKIGLERFRKASLRARKMRMMGSAALGLAYVASGRLDCYVEARISLWDIAAGKLLVEAAGGKVDLSPSPDHPDSLSIVATNGKIPIHEIL